MRLEYSLEKEMATRSSILAWRTIGACWATVLGGLKELDMTEVTKQPLPRHQGAANPQ